MQSPQLLLPDVHGSLLTLAHACCKAAVPKKTSANRSEPGASIQRICRPRLDMVRIRLRFVTNPKLSFCLWESSSAERFEYVRCVQHRRRPAARPRCTARPSRSCCRSRCSRSCTRRNWRCRTSTRVCWRFRRPASLPQCTGRSARSPASREKWFRSQMVQITSGSGSARSPASKSQRNARAHSN